MISKILVDKRNPFRNVDGYANVRVFVRVSYVLKRNIEGLGRETDLKYAESLLLFNSDINPYVEYEQEVDTFKHNLRQST